MGVKLCHLEAGVYTLLSAVEVYVWKDRGKSPNRLSGPHYLWYVPVSRVQESPIISCNVVHTCSGPVRMKMKSEAGAFSMH
jgi:hypothetical protein